MFSSLLRHDQGSRLSVCCVRDGSLVAWDPSKQMDAQELGNAGGAIVGMGVTGARYEARVRSRRSLLNAALKPGTW